MDLLKNAVESVQVGIEDYAVGTPARLRSCVRSIHAGILLLFKERLRQLSPVNTDEVLIKASVKAVRGSDGIVLLVGDGRRTVDVHQIRSRFDSLEIRTDWTRVDRITRTRNDIEHYFAVINKTSLRSLIADAFVVIREFVRGELSQDPRTLLGESAWQLMLEVAEVYQEERAECDALLSQVNWTSDTLQSGVRSICCSGCGSDLMRPLDVSAPVGDVVLVCSGCGEPVTAEDFVAAAIRAELGLAAHVAAKDGADEPYITCPACGSDAYVMAEQRCALCGEEAEHVCARCGCRIPESELGESMCGYCSHMMGKND